MANIEVEAQGPAGPPGDADAVIGEPNGIAPLNSQSQLAWPFRQAGKLFTFATGQSNAQANAAYPWTPPPNLQEWNWDRTEDGVGTAFVTPDATIIRRPTALAAEIARRLPNTAVYLINISWGQQSIDHWVGGIDRTFSTATTDADPGNGFVRLNNADPTLATAMFISKYTSDGYLELNTISNMSAEPWVEIRNADGSIVARYTPHSEVDHTNYRKVNLTYVSKTGTLTNGLAAKVRQGPDLYTIIQNNLPLALDAAGVTYPDVEVFVQGEGNSLDTGAGQHWRDQVNAYYARRVADGTMKDGTPTIVYGMVSGAIIGDSRFDDMNEVVEQFVAEQPDYRVFVYPAALPISYWDSSNYIHNNAEGWWRTGIMGANAYLSGASRGTVKGASYNAGTGQPTWRGKVVAPNGTASAPAATFGSAGAYYDGSVFGLSWAGTAFLTYQAGALTFSYGGGVATALYESDAGLMSLKARSYNPAAFGGQFYAEHSRGTPSVPLDLQQNDYAGEVYFRAGGSDGTFRSAANIRALIIEPTPSPTALGAALVFSAIPLGAATATELFRADQQSGIQIGGQAVITPAGAVTPKVYTIATLPVLPNPSTPGIIVYVSDLGGTSGSGGPVISDAAGRWRRMGVGGYGAPGNADTLFNILANAEFQNISTANNTADRVYTLDNTGMYPGARFYFHRNAIGSHKIDIVDATDSSVLFTFAAATGGNANFVSNGLAWKLMT